MAKRSHGRRHAGDKNMSEAEVEQYLRLIRIGMRSAPAAWKIGRTHAAMILKRKRDPEFLSRERKARASWRAKLCKSVSDAVDGGDVNTARWMLERMELSPIEQAKLEEIRARTEEARARTRAIEQRIDPDTAPDPDPRFE